jgi:hypothetical protein
MCWRLETEWITLVFVGPGEHCGARMSGNAQGAINANENERSLGAGLGRCIELGLQSRKRVPRDDLRTRGRLARRLHQLNQ